MAHNTPDLDQYIALFDDGTTREQYATDRFFDRVVDDIATGQHDAHNLGDVWKINLGTGTASLATEDVARAVLEKLVADKNTAGWNLRNWIENALGPCSANCVTDWAA